MPANPLEHASICWDVSPADFALIVQIAERAGRDLPDYPDDRRTLIMDLNACHSNGCALDLPALLAADAYEFSHDLYGIRKAINRRTGKLTEDCFLPRFALANQVTVTGHYHRPHPGGLPDAGRQRPGRRSLEKL